MNRCPWCGTPFVPVTRGRHRKRFCGPLCKDHFHVACREYGEAMIAAGLVTVPHLRAWAGTRKAQIPSCTTPRRAKGLPTSPDTGPRLSERPGAVSRLPLKMKMTGTARRRGNEPAPPDADAGDQDNNERPAENRDEAAWIGKAVRALIRDAGYSAEEVKTTLRPADHLFDDRWLHVTVAARRGRGQAA